MHIGDIVRLKDGNEEFYQMVSPREEGLIKDKKLDDNDFELIYVTWFDGGEDGWTFASHFDVVDKDTDLIVGFDQGTDQYMEEITEAFDDVAESEGFMTLSINRIVNPETGTVYLMPKIHTMAATKEASLAIDAQLIQIASEIYNNAVRQSLDLDEE